MKKALEELSKDLAKGVSRRTAFQRFFAAIAGLGAVALTSRPASAEPVPDEAGNSICVQLCREQGWQGKEFGACVAASAKCPPGECALVMNGGDWFCVPVGIGPC